ncbi:MAG: DUF2807 domain-containing protein [Bacteroidales bacterium]|nr:DUF2807 domain-containing protein [Bacteroidales bacterium]
MKKISLYKLFLIICTSIVYSSCKDGLFNPGAVVTREIQLSSIIFSVEVNTMLEITLVQDTINKALVTCSENLQSDIDIFVKDNILYLNNSIKYSWSRNYEKVKLELHLIKIPRLDIWKPSYITSRDTIKTHEFFLVDWGKFTELDVTLDVDNCAIDVSVEGFGHYTVKGKSTTATFYCKGSAFFYAEGLQVQNCTVFQNSIGDTYVNVLNKLTVTIQNSGKVYYYGNPSSIILNNNFSNDKLIHLPNN